MKRTTLIILLVAIEVMFFGPASVAQQSHALELNVFAAASLTEALDAIAGLYTAQDQGVKISFNFAGSQQLAQQIGQGASADLFVSANMHQMSEAAKSGRIDTSAFRIFAHNRLVVVYPKENGAGLLSLRDLTKDHIKIILADKAVPVGQYSLDVLEKCARSPEYGSLFRQDVIKNVVSYEENVRVVLSKIIMGEADAGIVYTSDISQNARHEVGTIEIPEKFNVVAAYPVAVVLDSKHREQAEKFMAFLLSDEGQTVLARFGFIPIRSKGPGR